MSQIKSLIDNNRDTIYELFNSYNITAPVNVKSLSAAIIANSNDDGNPFLDDLERLVKRDYANYEDILGLNAKGKAKRQERKAAHGGKSIGGRFLGGVGKVFKGNKKTGAASGAESSPLILAANSNEPALNSGIITESKRKVSVGDVLDTVGDIVGAASSIFGGGGSGGTSSGSGSGGGVDDGGGDNGGGGAAPTQGFDWKKWALPIGGTVVLLTIVLVFAFKGKKGK